MSPPPASSSTTVSRIPPWHDFLCGALAGMSARMMVAPLDVVKIRFQVQSVHSYGHQYRSVLSSLLSIARTEGPLALWKGNVPALLMVTPYAAIQLATFYQLRPHLAEYYGEPYATLGTGAIAASTATVITYPLDLLRTLAAARDGKGAVGLTRAARHIVSVRGVRGLYAGLQPTLVEIVPYMASYMWLYERIKKVVVDHHNNHKRNELDNTNNDNNLNSFETLGIGAFTGVVTKLATLPLDTAKKVMQIQSQFQIATHTGTSSCHHLQESQQRQQFRGIVHVLTFLYRRHGITAWFRGAAPSVLKAAPNSAVTFMVYERSKQYLLKLRNRQESSSS